MTAGMVQYIDVEEGSLAALYLETLFDGQSISSATGFIVSHGGRPVLLTNWHVVTERHNQTNQLLSETGAEPNQLRIHHRALGGAFRDLQHVEKLIENASPRWTEHPV